MLKIALTRVMKFNIEFYSFVTVLIVHSGTAGETQTKSERDYLPSCFVFASNLMKTRLSQDKSLHNP